MIKRSALSALKTTSVVSGMALSIDLAREVSAKLAATLPENPLPAATEDEPGRIPVELIASILFSAVCLANNSWKS